MGYYHRDRGLWVPSDNGVVVKLLDTDTNGIVDALDANGDELPDDLDADGSLSDEVIGLTDSLTYPPNATFWRVAVSHFTPWDHNWPFGAPPDATRPNPRGEPQADTQKDEGKDCFLENSSFTEQRSRIFHEDIPILGTDMTLHNASNRANGYKTVISVPVSGETVPASLKNIIVKAEVARRCFEQVLDPLPDQKMNIVWDGMDHLHRPVKHPATVRINLGFVYDAYYYTARPDLLRSFALMGEDWNGIRARREITIWKRNHITAYAPRGVIAEGWTVSSHHHVHPLDPFTLYRGDGSLEKNDIYVITTVAGAGNYAYGGDGGPANEAQLHSPIGVLRDARGNLYVADRFNHRIRMIDINGTITTVAGGGNPPDGLGDGGPAADASLIDPWDMAMDASGNLYIGDLHHHRIRKVDANGIITTVAGNGTDGVSGDGGPANQAQLNRPGSVVMDTSGNLYITDRVNHRIRMVDTNGIITTVAGGGNPSTGIGDGGPATDAKLMYPEGIAVDASGNLYIADKNHHRIRMVGICGIITTIAGTGTYGYSGDGGLAVEARLRSPCDVALGAAGNIYIADKVNDCIRKIDTSGVITTVAGIGTHGFGGDGGLAIDAMLYEPAGLTVDNSGCLYIGDSLNHRIRKVGPPSVFVTSLSSGDIPFAAKNGLGHIVSSAGNHKTTIDLGTGIELYAFGYDQGNKLVSIMDQFGNETKIVRDGSGKPTAFASPDGLTTSLVIDANNHLKRITYPDNSFYDFEYTSGGLLTAKIEPEGNRFEHQFDSTGRLTDATDMEGGHWQYIRTADASGDILTEIITGEGNVASYLDQTSSTGEYTSTITGPAGTETFYAQSADGLTVQKSLPCGMALEIHYGMDPSYKFMYVIEGKETTPSSLEKITLTDKTYEDTNSDNNPDRITESVIINGKATFFQNNILQSQKTVVSTEGRMVTALYDPDTLLTTILSIPGPYETTYGYDNRGKLTSTTTNTRETTFTYNSQGFLESITNSEDYTTSHTYDAIGRITGISRPDGTSLVFTYDKNGNMTLLTTPSTIHHGFGYNAINLNSSYQTPISGTYSYVYDKDRRLTQTNFPSGSQINHIYDKTRLI